MLACLLRALTGVALTVHLLAQAPSSEPLVIRGVTVIACSGAAPQPDRTVVVDDGRITAIGDADLAVPGTPRELDGHGRFLIPGLWDMHVHMTAMPGFAEMFVVNGVTGVRDMFGSMRQLEPLRRAIAAGARPGPRIVAAGRIVDGEKPIWPGSYEAKDAEGGTKAVATVIGEGSDFVKVYSKLSRAAYFAIAAECKERGVVFAGHVPRTVTVAEAAAAGQRSIEHLTGVLEGCCDDEVRANDAEVARIDRLRLQVETFDAAKAEAMAVTLRRHDTWMCPTLTVLRAVAFLDDSTFTSDERVRYMSPFLVGMWRPKNDKRFAAMTADDWTMQRRAYERQREVTTLLHAQGVRFLAGTDTGNPYCFPGFSLHDELQLLVQAGFTPQEALAAATHDAATYLGLDAELGTIAVGKVASLVLLDADPLQDITNTTKIQAVVAAGRLFDRARLDAMLAALAPAKK